MLSLEQSHTTSPVHVGCASPYSPAHQAWPPAIISRHLRCPMRRRPPFTSADRGPFLALGQLWKVSKCTVTCPIQAKSKKKTRMQRAISRSGHTRTEYAVDGLHLCMATSTALLPGTRCGDHGRPCRQDVSTSKNMQRTPGCRISLSCLTLIMLCNYWGQVHFLIRK